MAVLTQIIKMPDGDRNPLLMEVPIPPGLDGPFLVTSTRHLHWIAKRLPNGMVRSAVREATLSEVFRGLVREVAGESQDRAWGSLGDPTPEGVRKVIHHLADYDLTNVEVLFGEGFDMELIPPDIPSGKVEWVPPGWAVFLPVDRAFVGTAFDWGGRVAVVVHNAPRGMGILLPSGGS